MVAGQAAQLATPAALRALLEAVPSGLVVLNPSAQIVYANRHFRELLATNSSVAIEGRRLGEVLECVNAATGRGGCGTAKICRTCGVQLALQALSNGDSVVQEGRILCRRGKSVESLEVRLSVTTLPVGTERYQALAITDISNEKRRLALERVFFHDVLNTAGVLVNLTALAEPDAAGKLDAGIVQDLRRYLGLLLDEILAQRELMLAESGELATSPRPLDAVAVLAEVVDLYRQHRVCEDRQLRVAPRTRRHELVSDAAILRRVLGNLVKNALEACASGQRVTVGCQNNARGVSFTVHNPGVIPPDVQLQIFNRSFSTKGKGRGLGTYCIKLLTERYLGGRVSFRSAEPRGTRFCVHLPLVLPATPVTSPP